MMKKTILAVALLSTALVACSKHNDTPAPASTPSETSSSPTETPKVSASDVATATAPQTLPKNWTGHYMGELPCADCDGIKTEITLNANHTYEIKETYLGKGKTKPFITKNKLSFDPKNPATVILNNDSESHKYLLETNKLTALDMDGNKIDGSMAAMYVLKKVK